MTQDRNVRISIIIPHYNSPKLLLKAVSSARVNDFTEVIAVDDKSDLPENVLEKLGESLRRKGVTFLKNDTPGKGAGVCRNIGLENAHGEWLMFLDADDLLTDGWYDSVVRSLSEEYDMIYFPPTSLNLSTGGRSTRHVMYEELVMQYLKDPSRANETELKYGFCTPWSKLFRRRLIDEYAIRFDETAVSNDIMFVTKCAFHARKIKAVPDVIYCVTRTGKTLTSKKSEKNFWTRIDVLADRYAFLKDNLSGKDFRDTHIGQYVFGQMVSAVAGGYGIKTALKLTGYYRRHGMKLAEAGFFDAGSFWRKAKMLILWFSDIRKSKSRERASQAG